MYVNSPTIARDLISPFGNNFHVPAGFQTRVDVKDGYWLVKRPELEVKFESDEEFEECQRLLEQAKLNPLKGLPKPQSVTPNATLQLEGYALRIPVLVVNPQGLLQEPVPEYHFQQPVVNLVFDEAMVLQVFERFHEILDNKRYAEASAEHIEELDKLQAPELTVDGPAPELPTDLTELTTEEWEALTAPDTSDVEVPIQPNDVKALPEDGGLEAETDAPGEASTSETTEAAPPEESEAPATDAKGKGRARRGGINDEDI